ncbi:hypothetical protein TNCV_1039691 [Trichonephila clavipes]|nr:hypothetical protein TNCV_1039691 [Trichonephila clavipes]
MLENSSKIGRPDWTTSEPAGAFICQKSYLKLGMVLDVVVVVSRTEHAVDEEDAVEIDKLSEAVETVSITELEEVEILMAMLP